MRYFFIFLLAALTYTVAFDGPTTAGAAKPKASKPHAPKKAKPKVRHHAKKAAPKKKAKKPKKVAKAHKKPAAKAKPASKKKVKPPARKAKRAHRADPVKIAADKANKLKKRHEAITRFYHEREVNTRHFAHFDTRTSAYSFDSHWWNHFVANPPPAGPDGSDPGDDSPGAPPPGEALTPPQVDAPVIQQNVALAPPPVIKAGEALPTGRDWADLVALLDGLDVEHHWLPGKKVYWKTGNIEDDDDGPETNCGAFVAAVCVRMKAPILASSTEDFAPETQYDWLMQDGKARGWLMVADVEAQLLANQGWVVIAAWKNLDTPGEQTVSGQTAIVRPSKRHASEIARDGPRITAAGLQNHNDVSLKEGFPAQAWDKHEVAYFAHRAR